MNAVKPLRRDAQRNRERILTAARDVFAAGGVHATLDDVAAHAGVGVGTVYRRFPNKDALLDELFEQRIADVAELAEAALSNTDAWEALIRFLEGLEEMCALDRALEHLVLHTGRGDERLARARERLLAPIGALVERAKADGRLRGDFEASDIRMLHTMFGAVVQETDETSPDLWRRYFTIIVDGLASQRSCPTPMPVPAPGPTGATASTPTSG
jgi:AcrR family transcriptional regulator